MTEEDVDALSNAEFKAILCLFDAERSLPYQTSMALRKMRNVLERHYWEKLDQQTLTDILLRLWIAGYLVSYSPDVYGLSQGCRDGMLDWLSKNEMGN